MFGLDNLPWYKAADHKLQSSQTLVRILLVAIIVVSAYLLFFGDNVERTGWVVYMFMP